MNIDTNKYYNYRSSVLGKYIDRDSRRWMACGELNSKGYNTTPYGVFK